MKINNRFAFTLVELIIVVTIIAILSAIGFVSYSGYLNGVRDTNRISQLRSIADGLRMYSTKAKLPIPDAKKTIILSGSTQIATQGYAGKNVLEAIEYSSEGVDPKDGNYFSYYLTKNKKHFQLMAWLEEKENLQTKIQAVDYSNRFPFVYGNSLGILTNINNLPIQELTGSFNIPNVGNIELKSYLNNGQYIEGSGTAIVTELKKLSDINDNGGKNWIVKDNKFVYVGPKLSCGSDFKKILDNKPLNLCKDGILNNIVLDNGPGTSYQWRCKDNKNNVSVCYAYHKCSGSSAYSMSDTYINEEIFCVKNSNESTGGYGFFYDTNTNSYSIYSGITNIGVIDNSHHIILSDGNYDYFFYKRYDNKIAMHKIDYCGENCLGNHYKTFGENHYGHKYFLINGNWFKCSGNKQITNCIQLHNGDNISIGGNYYTISISGNTLKVNSPDCSSYYSQPECDDHSSDGCHWMETDPVNHIGECKN